MKRLANAHDIFGLHHRIHRVHLTGLTRREVNHRVRHDRNHDQEQQALHDRASDEAPHQRRAPERADRCGSGRKGGLLREFSPVTKIVVELSRRRELDFAEGLAAVRLALHLHDAAVESDRFGGFVQERVRLILRDQAVHLLGQSDLSVEVVFLTNQLEQPIDARILVAGKVELVRSGLARVPQLISIRVDLCTHPGQHERVEVELVHEIFEKNRTFEDLNFAIDAQLAPRLLRDGHDRFALRVSVGADQA